MSEPPARHFNLAGASNFRDLGGYPGRDGRRLRWRRIFRSNHLGHVTDADIDVLRGLDLKRAFDFRGAEERRAAICPRWRRMMPRECRARVTLADEPRMAADLAAAMIDHHLGGILVRAHRLSNQPLRH